MVEKKNLHSTSIIAYVRMFLMLHSIDMTVMCSVRTRHLTACKRVVSFIAI